MPGKKFRTETSPHASAARCGCDKIAAGIEFDARLDGMLVKRQLAAKAVVSLIYPRVNSEDSADGLILDNTVRETLAQWATTCSTIPSAL